MTDKPVSRTLVVILHADVAGSTALVQRDEALAHTRLTDAFQRLASTIKDYGGTVHEIRGDALVAEFARVSDAVTAALVFQQTNLAHNATLNDTITPMLRMGVSLGEVIIADDTVTGPGVVLAQRLEQLAEPGGVCIQQAVYEALPRHLPFDYDALGEQQLKGFDEPVRAYAVKLRRGADVPAPESRTVTNEPRSRRKGILATVTALVVIGVLAWWQPWRPEFEPASEARMVFPLPDKPSIAVLPFANMSDDPKQEYFVDGMTDDLITDLSKLSGLFVIARNSVFTYKGKPVKVQQVAEELGIRYVLEGSVRRAGDQVRINAQLVDATTGGHLWAERYDGTLDDVFAFQDSVTREIVAALAIAMTDEEIVEHARLETDNAGAHDAFLRGWAYYKLLTPEDLAQAVPFLEEAIRVDSAYARAHAALASLYWDVFRNNWAYDLDMPSFRAEKLAHEHLESALKAPNTLAHALQARMFASFGFYDDAVTSARQAVSLDTNDATAHAGLAYALVFADRPAEAIKPIEMAMRLDPHHPPSYLITLGAAQFGVERYNHAVVTFERAVKSNPSNELPWIYLASIYGHLGQIREADKAIEAVNDVRFAQGLGELSLRDPSAFPYRVVDRKDDQLDWARFGQHSAQERVRAGLIDIPALTWQYRITWIRGFGEFESISLEVEGASEIDIKGAKALYDRGAVFIDASSPESFKEQHISGSVNLPYYRSLDPTQTYFTQEALMAIADKTQEVVLFCDRKGCLYPAWVTAKAANWGYESVFFFKGGKQAWDEAGYFVEKGG